MAGKLVGDGSGIKQILCDIFELMDDNSDGCIDQDEGVAIGVAMGETADQAKMSWKAMCKDMDDDENATIEQPEWLDFYNKSLKDAPEEDVLNMLNAMKEQIAANKAK
jgi:Ca2+-binding EF-hand superfamily protein